MKDRLIQNFLAGMDEEQARNILNDVDEEQVEQVVQWAVDDTVVPWLEDIRDREAEDDVTSEQVREYYESMSPEEREQEFYETLDNLVATLVQCRESPSDGFSNLKAFLRDPFTVEALLLIFENEDHIDAEYTEQLKDFGAEHLRWVGAMVVPEMYEQHEVEQVMERMNMDPEGGESDASPGGRG